MERMAEDYGKELRWRSRQGRLTLRVVCGCILALTVLRVGAMESDSTPSATPGVPGLHLPAMWEYSAPLIAPEKRAREPSHAQKDPTIVQVDGRWHVFMTVKLPDRSAIEYVSFDDWREADAAPRTILEVSESAYLFFTSLNGKMWRMWTRLEDFPNGFDHCEIALEAEIFEASHTYRVRDSGGFLTFIEQDHQRYFKAYYAERLDGEWVPLADTPERPFAGWNNIRPAPGVEPWTDNVSHGELVRANNDERLVIDPDDLRLVIQGMLDRDKEGHGYGRFSWRIGMLTPVEGGR